MNKLEFLSGLENALAVLQEEELRDILSEYEQHIDMKVQSGLSEEEAIEDFGSFQELTAEILDAYHVRTDYAKADPKKNWDDPQAYAGQAGTGRTYAGQTYTGRTYAEQMYAGQTGTGRTYAEQTYAGQAGTGQTYAEQPYAGQAGMGRADAGEAGAGQTGAGQGNAGRNGTETASGTASGRQTYARQPGKISGAVTWTWNVTKKIAAWLWECVKKSAVWLWLAVLWLARQMLRPFAWGFEKLKAQEQRRKEGKKTNMAPRDWGQKKENGERSVWSMAAKGFAVCFRWCWDAIVWCVRLIWNLCCVGVALLTGCMGLAILFMTGMLAVLLIDGYPLTGLTVLCVGVMLCAFAFTGLALTLIWRGKPLKKKKRGPEGSENTEGAHPSDITGKAERSAADSSGAAANGDFGLDPSADSRVKETAEMKNAAGAEGTEGLEKTAGARKLPGLEKTAETKELPGPEKTDGTETPAETKRMPEIKEAAGEREFPSVEKTDGTEKIPGLEKPAEPEWDPGQKKAAEPERNPGQKKPVEPEWDLDPEKAAEPEWDLGPEKPAEPKELSAFGTAAALENAAREEIRSERSGKEEENHA